MNEPILLLAEDSEEDVLLIKRAFEKGKLPFQLQRVEDGREAIRYLAGKQKYSDREHYPFPAAVLTDLKMPGVDGFELLEWLRAQSEFQKLPVIVLTGSNEYEDRQRALNLGANSYLVKELLLSPPPGFTEALLHCIKKAA